MKELRKNIEGYPDPTAYAAILRADHTDYPRTYICSPFRGDVELNVSKTIRYCRYAVERGKFPIAPHLFLPRFMDDDNPAERELALSFGLRLLAGCREIWVFGDTVSEGMRREIAEAVRKHIKIRRFSERCEEMFADTRFGGNCNG